MNVTEESISPAETFDCRNYLPPLKLYYAEYIIPLSLSLTVGCIVWLWVTFVFVKVIKLIRRQTEKGQVMVLIIANTTVVTFNVVALLVPHVAVVCDIVPFVAFCWCILVFFRYLKESVGGDSIIMGLYESKALDPPKVCPCFRFIYDRKRQLRAIRFGILQLPIYNSVVASIQLLIFSYDKASTLQTFCADKNKMLSSKKTILFSLQDLFVDAFYIILPFIITSIVFYVGSSVSFIKTVAPLYPDNPIFVSNYYYCSNYYLYSSIFKIKKNLPNTPTETILPAAVGANYYQTADHYTGAYLQSVHLRMYLGRRAESVHK
uniref:Uncharacterized protein n=1 Tax=Anopheles melas TaxID=34690 RepID=A0A182UER1_9DIPT